MNYKKILNKISIDLIDVDTQLELTYPALPKGYLKESIIRTGGEPIYPLVGCRQIDSERIMLLSGVARLDDAIDNNRTHVEVLIIDACLDASNLDPSGPTKHGLYKAGC